MLNASCEKILWKVLHKMCKRILSERKESDMMAFDELNVVLLDLKKTN